MILIYFILFYYIFYNKMKFYLFHKNYINTILDEELSYHQINNNIFLGNIKAARDINFIESNNITHIINVTSNIPNYFDNINYLNIPINTNNLNNPYNFDYYFNLSNSFLSNIINNNYKVLIHCKYGHTRSTLFLTIFLIYYYNLTPDQAIYYIRSIRPNTLLRIIIIKIIHNWYNKNKLKN